MFIKTFLKYLNHFRSHLIFLHFNRPLFCFHHPFHFQTLTWNYFLPICHAAFHQIFLVLLDFLVHFFNRIFLSKIFFLWWILVIIKGNQEYERSIFSPHGLACYKSSKLLNYHFTNVQPKADSFFIQLLWRIQNSKYFE